MGITEKYVLKNTKIHYQAQFFLDWEPFYWLTLPA
jgi:hypothetical protein